MLTKRAHYVCLSVVSGHWTATVIESNGEKKFDGIDTHLYYGHMQLQLNLIITLSLGSMGTDCVKCETML